MSHQYLELESTLSRISQRYQGKKSHSIKMKIYPERLKFVIIRLYRSNHWRISLFTILCLLLVNIIASAQEKITIGGKNFNENFILAEMMAQLLESEGFVVERKLGMGGTLVCFTALETGEIDVYPEYSGTIARAILKLFAPAPYDSIQNTVYETYQMELLEPFGFNNTYAIAMNRTTAAARDVQTVSDLRACTDCKLGFSLEFLNRQDGWIGLKQAYGLPQNPSGMEHGLSYMAIQNGEIDATDAYSTDGDIAKYDLILLQDDKQFFPIYLGAPLVRSDFPERGKAILGKLANTLDEQKMQALNAQVIIDGKTFAEAASSFLLKEGLIRDADVQNEGFWARLQRRTVRHIFLTIIALAAAILIAVPLGVAIYRVKKIGKPVLYFTGLFLNDTRLIMEGAIPAALLAILVELIFELVERVFIPAHLLQKS